MHIIIYSREDLTKPIESNTIGCEPDLTIAGLLARYCHKYSESVRPLLSAYANKELVPYEDWNSYKLGKTSELMFIIEAGGLETGAIVAIISAVMAVASVVYSLISMHRLGSPSTGNTKTGSTIYDVNAQGNKVKLQQVIPENFGLFKKFPDYLCDRHTFYRNNKYFIDLVLCQGRGYYQHSENYDDIYIANTPLSEFNDGSVQVRIYDPSTVITAQNSIEDGCWYGWYSSIEVTSQGKTLEGVVEQTESTASATYETTLGDDEVTCYKTTYQATGGIGCAGGSGGAVLIRKPYLLPWDVGSYIRIRGIPRVRKVGDENNDYSTEINNDTVTLYIDKSSNITDLKWLRARVTEIDPDTEEEVIKSAGDIIRVTYERHAIITYMSRPYGSQGSRKATAENVNTENFDAEILAITMSGDLLTITVSAQEVSIPQYPDYPSVNAITIIEQHKSDTITVYQPLPADYTYDSDDGIYRIDRKSDATTYLTRVTSSYVTDPNWEGFWTQGLVTTDVVYSLDNASSSSAGTWVGPYRACPVGAVSNKFEVDIMFPAGIGTLNNSGGIDSRTIDIEIQYREAGSNNAWESVDYHWTNNTNDELAYTISIDTETSGNYEFRIKNLSNNDENIQALQTVKWVGLKSRITDKNQYDDMTVIICRFKGTETLSELSQNQIWTLWNRKLPALDVADENLNDPAYMTATRDIAPVVKYICDNSKYKGIVDMDSLREYDAYWRSKGMKLDGTLDDDNTLLEALRDVLKAGFSSLTVYDNRLSFCKLHKQAENEPLVQIFTPQNLVDSPKATITLRRDDSINEVVVEFIDPETYKTATRYIHLDSNGDSVVTLYPTSNCQETLNAFGVVQEEVAIAMGCRRLRYLTYTNTKYEIKTELDGLNCKYNDLVGIVLDHNLSNISGRILGVDQSNITVDREIPEALAGGIIYIRKMDGSMFQTTYRRIDSRTLELYESLPFEWSSDYGTIMEYPFFAIGELVKCWINNVKPSGKSCILELVNYDERVFDDDL